MALQEKTFIDLFAKVENSSRLILTDITDHSSEIFYQKAAGLQELFIQYGEMLEEQISWCRDLINKGIEEHAGISLKENIAHYSQAVTLCEELCELIYKMTVCSDDDFENILIRFRQYEGKFSLLLRFEILSDLEFETNDNGLQRAVAILNETSCITGDYYPIHFFTNRICRHYFPKYNIDDVAIILQGQIRYEDDFTLETLYRYRYLYPITPIIVSTWKNEVSDDFKWRALSIGVDILENDYPDEPGRYHINYQMCSSRNGIELAKEKYNIKYALKTRSDQRFYLPEFINYFKSEMKLFPLKEQGNIKERIVLNGTGASVWSFPFRVSDFWAYGNADDLINLYSAPYSPDMGGNAHKKIWSDAPYENAQLLTSMDKDERFKKAKNHEGFMDSESYIMRTYYEKYILGRPLNPDTDDIYLHYWHFVRDYLIIDDSKTFIMYWPKYRNKSYEYDNCTCEGDLSHSTWLNYVMRSL